MTVGLVMCCNCAVERNHGPLWLPCKESLSTAAKYILVMLLPLGHLQEVVIGYSVWVLGKAGWDSDPHCQTLLRKTALRKNSQSAPKI